MDNKDFKNLVKEMFEFLSGKEPELLRVYKCEKIDGKWIRREVINTSSLELIKE